MCLGASLKKLRCCGLRIVSPASLSRGETLMHQDLTPVCNGAWQDGSVITSKGGQRTSCLSFAAAARKPLLRTRGWGRRQGTSALLRDAPKFLHGACSGRDSAKRAAGSLVSTVAQELLMLREALPEDSPTNLHRRGCVCPG